MAAVTLVVAALAGCSSADSSSLGEGAASLGTGAEANEAETGGSDTGEGSDTGDEDTDTDTDDGTGTSGEEPPVPNGIEDPPPLQSACDPGVEHQIVLDLGDANTEAAPVLVTESVLYGDGSVPAIPLSQRTFLNRYEFGYPPADTELLEISGELWEAPAGLDEQALRYGLQYAIRAPAWALERPPLDLAVVVDLGLAMDGEPIVLAEAAVATIESALLPGDRVTLIGAGEQPIVLASTQPLDLLPTALTGLLDVDELDSFADVGAALDLAYDTLESDWQYSESAQARVLLISNGHFVNGEDLSGRVAQASAEHVVLSSLGVGDPAQYDNAAMQALAGIGQGSTLFSRSAEGLEHDLGERLADHLMSTTRELELSLTLPEGLSLRTRSPLEDLSQPEPRHAQLGPSETLVFHFELEACAQLEPEATIVVELSWIDATSNEAHGLVWERSLNDLGPASSRAQKGAATVAYARALQSYRDALDPMESYALILDAMTQVSEALALLGEDPELLEMSSVLASLES